MTGSVIFACTVMWDFWDKDAGRKGFVADIEVGCCDRILWEEKERKVRVKWGSRKSWSVHRLWSPRPLAFHVADRRLINPERRGRSLTMQGT